jgi:hypothetical protein
MFESMEFLLGALFGIAIGISIGLSLGGKKKSWSELTDKEKKLMIVLIVIGCLLFIAGLTGFFVFRARA